MSSAREKCRGVKGVYSNVMTELIKKYNRRNPVSVSALSCYMNTPPAVNRIQSFLRTDDNCFCMGCLSCFMSVL